MSSARAKIVLLGPSNSGKTALFRCLAGESFIVTQPTVHSMNDQLILQANGDSVDVSLWDTAGQERFKSLSAPFLRGAHIALLVVDATQPSALDRLEPFVAQLESVEPHARQFLVVNKLDRAPATEQMIRYAQRHHITLIQVSAKTGEGVHDTLVPHLVRCLLSEPASPSRGAPLQIGNGSDSDDGGCSC